jgi:hypothetical protein
VPQAERHRNWTIPEVFSASMANVTAMSLLLAAAACSSPERAPFQPDCSGCGIPSGPSTNAYLECGTNRGAEEDPLVGQIGAFASDDFDPNLLSPVEESAHLSVLGASGRSLACTTYYPPDDFLLRGGAPGSGALRIDPEGAAFFVPTMIHKIQRSAAIVPSIPVFTSEQMEALVRELRIDPDPERAQVIVSFSRAGIGRREAQSGVSIQCDDAEGIAYRSVDGWSRDESDTSEFGLALAYNVLALPNLGTRVVLTVELPDGASQEHEISAGNGAVTFAVLGP